MKSAAEIVLVISNKAGVKGLDRAQAASINTKVLAQHKGTQASLQTAGTHTKVPRFYRKLQALTQHKGTQTSLQTAGIYTKVHFTEKLQAFTQHKGTQASLQTAGSHTTCRYTQRYTGFTANCRLSHNTKVTPAYVHMCVGACMWACGCTCMCAVMHMCVYV